MCSVKSHRPTTYPLPVTRGGGDGAGLPPTAADIDEDTDDDAELGLELRKELAASKILLPVNDLLRLNILGRCFMCGRRDKMLGLSGACLATGTTLAVTTISFEDVSPLDAEDFDSNSTLIGPEFWTSGRLYLSSSFAKFSLGVGCVVLLESLKSNCLVRIMGRRTLSEPEENNK